jgi:5-aminolevulinate synthase
VSEHDWLAARIHIIEGALAKAFGCHGGYIASDAGLVDDIRSCAHGFTFTPPEPDALAEFGGCWDWAEQAEGREATGSGRA